MKALYNRYISEQDQYIPIPEEAPAGGKTDGAGTPPVQEKRSTGLFRGALGSLSLEGASLTGILQRFHLENLDSGDILLGLIILFLILEDGDNLDLIITLGLMILFSLGDPSD